MQTAAISTYASTSILVLTVTGISLVGPTPNTGESAPVGFATVIQRDGRWDMQAFWVAPAVRRDGLGSAFARDVIARHPGAWEIAFQEGNVGAAVFWRRIAASVWGESWVETTEPVPGKPDVPPDHWIRTR